MWASASCQGAGRTDAPERRQRGRPRGCRRRHAAGSAGEPADIADVVAFLASEPGRWVTGQNIPVGGGAF
ncbi:SDR family oxidoreductase [Actinopolymorpha sp. B9G3]|uniref:SDR family oxidoreductase n=1 Tax=Actinopolymorpha sp. B9G3 TaxID=3158970 RepID=UPI0032D8F7EC